MGLERSFHHPTCRTARWGSDRHASLDLGWFLVRAMEARKVLSLGELGIRSVVEEAPAGLRRRRRREGTRCGLLSCASLYWYLRVFRRGDVNKSSAILWIYHLCSSMERRKRGCSKDGGRGEKVSCAVMCLASKSWYFVHGRKVSRGSFLLSLNLRGTD